jgi:hypothetical protein
MASAILRRALLWAIVVLGALYVGDSLALHYRIRNGGTAAVTATVTILYGTPLKNGQVNIFWDQPQTQVCARSLFPHLGYPPCWYAKRHTTRLITESWGLTAPTFSSPRPPDLQRVTEAAR